MPTWRSMSPSLAGAGGSADAGRGRFTGNQACYRSKGAGWRGQQLFLHVKSGPQRPWLAIAILKTADGFEAARVTESGVVGQYRTWPGRPAGAEGQHLTAEDVGGDLSKIDTRQPPSSMHDDDFKDVVGKKPVVLIFATSALCQSRVCGPVVDVAERVGDKSARSSSTTRSTTRTI